MASGARAVTCCVAGGGPAGMMLGLLLARAGVSVLVIEKHADFLRDFRGDTIHPSTLELMHELGLLEDFLALPHQEVPPLIAQVGGVSSPRRLLPPPPDPLPLHRPDAAVDFLDFLARQASRYPTFHLLMETEATGL